MILNSEIEEISYMFVHFSLNFLKILFLVLYRPQFHCHKFRSHASRMLESTTVLLSLKNCPCREQGSNYLYVRASVVNISTYKRRSFSFMLEFEGYEASIKGLSQLLHIYTHKVLGESPVEVDINQSSLMYFGRPFVLLCMGFCLLPRIYRAMTFRFVRKNLPSSISTTILLP